jgi:glyoxylase-like metal-dependent hydrolase (beta-lactamase superfamily II)
MTDAPHYEVYAIKYAEALRQSRDYFIFPDPHNGPMPMNYYVWLIRGEGRIILVDTGFDHKRAETRQRAILRLPTEGLASLGVAPEDVQTIILTHLHYDHAGCIDHYPNAEFWVQDEEVRFATGRYMRYPAARMAFEPDDVSALIRKNYAERVRFVDGPKDLCPGVSLIPAVGHSRGLMAVSVTTQRGLVVLASDAAHFYENVTLNNPFPIVASVPEMCESHERLIEIAGGIDHFIPGHDAKVAELYPAVEADPMIYDLTVPPSGSP